MRLGVSAACAPWRWEGSAAGWSGGGLTDLGREMPGDQEPLAPAPAGPLRPAGTGLLRASGPLCQGGSWTGTRATWGYSRLLLPGTPPPTCPREGSRAGLGHPGCREGHVSGVWGLVKPCGFGISIQRRLSEVIEGWVGCGA